MLMFCLGSQIGEAIEAADSDSDEFEWIRLSDGGFQQVFLLCSVGKTKAYITDKPAVKAHLFGIGRKDGAVVALDDGEITDNDAISSIGALLKLLKGERTGRRTRVKARFRSEPTVLFYMILMISKSANRLQLLLS